MLLRLQKSAYFTTQIFNCILQIQKPEIIFDFLNTNLLEDYMALSNLYGWTEKKQADKGASCGTACGASDKPAACGTACGAGEKPSKPEKKPAACGTACGAGDKPAK